MENNTTNNKTESLFIRISEEDKAALMDIAEKIDVPFSQIAREAIREKVATLKATQAETAAVTA